MNQELMEEGWVVLEETPEVKQSSLKQLRQLLQEEEGFRVPTDDILTMCLRGRKYRVEDALRTVKNYFRARRDMPEYFENLTPSSIPYKTVFRDHKLIYCPKQRDSQGRGIVMFRFGAWSTEICPMTELVRCFIVAVGCIALQEETQIRGALIIDDLEGLKFHHVIQMTPGFLRRIITLFQDCLPVPMKGFYFLNTPVVFERIYTLLVKPFLSEKLKSRIHLLRGGFSELRGIIPSEIMPKEHGGAIEDFDFNRQELFFQEKESDFETACHYGYIKK